MSVMVDRVSYEYPGAPPTAALRDVSMRVAPGEVAAVLGPSGCGKTTLLNVVAGLIEPSEGQVRIEGADDRRVGYVFQQALLIPWLSVWRNALFGVEAGGGRATAGTLAEAEELFDLCGLRGFEGRFPAQLSGGMAQRLAIVRAVLSGARCLLLDEAFSSSDFALRRELQLLLSGLIERRGLMTMMATHDVSDALRFADQVVVLSERPGRVRGHLRIPVCRHRRLRGDPEALQALVPLQLELEGMLMGAGA